MSQPTAYTPASSFLDYQASHTTAPFNGANLDTEFEAIELTTDEILTNLALIQKDDGELTNEIVSIDSLDASVLALFTAFDSAVIQGAWVTSTLYAVGDLVSKGGVGYVCTIAHTSGVFATDLTAEKWAALGGSVTVSFTTAGDLTVIGNTTIGDTSADTLTVNAGTWTIGSNYTQTRAAGALGAGTTNIITHNFTLSGHSGGTTDARGQQIAMTVSGGNAITTVTGLLLTPTFTGTAVLTNMVGASTRVEAGGTAAVTNLIGNNLDLVLSAAGAVTNAYGYRINTPTFTSTGAITTLFGHYTANLGNALVADAYGYYAEDMTGATNSMVGFIGQLSAGAGKFNCYMGGTAINFFRAAVRIGANTATNNGAGLVINQLADDDEILTLVSSDVAHGVTNSTGTGTFGWMKKASATAGGLQIGGAAEDGTVTAIQFVGVGDTDVTKTTAGTGVFSFNAYENDGTTTAAAMTANSNMAVFRMNTTTRFILDSDGDSHQDVGTAWTNFDDDDDVLALDALSYNVAHDSDPIKRLFGDWMREHREKLEDMKLVKFSEDGHHFVNMSKLAMLNTGAIRQLARRLEHMESQLLLN